MKPYNVLAWFLAISVSVLIVAGTSFLIADWSSGTFTNLIAFLSAETPIVTMPIFVAAIVVLVAAFPATLVVRYFRSSKGDLQFSALGIKFKGPAGPILLWVVAFLASSAVILLVLKL
jgi:hypothetical protein